MGRTLFVSVVAAALVVLMAGSALAHVCFVPGKPAGAGSAGTATLIVDVDVVLMTEVETFIPGPNLFNPKNGRVKGGFVTTDVIVNVFEDGVFQETITDTQDLFFQNTVGGQAHFAGPGDSGCDGVGIDSLEVCFEGP